MAKAEDKDAERRRTEAVFRKGCAATGGGEGPVPPDMVDGDELDLSVNEDNTGGVLMRPILFHALIMYVHRLHQPPPTPSMPTTPIYMPTSVSCTS